MAERSIRRIGVFLTKNARHLMAVTAHILVALLVTSTTGLADAAIACICPDGEVEVAVADVCTCCHPAGSEDSAASAEESQMIQELHSGLARMERRVESLETLLLERERREVRHDV